MITKILATMTATVAAMPMAILAINATGLHGVALQIGELFCAVMGFSN